MDGEQEQEQEQEKEEEKGQRRSWFVTEAYALWGFSIVFSIVGYVFVGMFNQAVPESVMRSFAEDMQTGGAIFIPICAFLLSAILGSVFILGGGRIRYGLFIYIAIALSTFQFASLILSDVLISQGGATAGDPSPGVEPIAVCVIVMIGPILAVLSCGPAIIFRRIIDERMESRAAA